MGQDARGSGVFAVAADANRRRVLIVDDHVDSAELLAEVLGAQGHEARVAHDPTSAVRAALELKPEVVILDIGLPGMTGYELLQVLREQPELAACRFIALTGHAEPADRRRSHEAGFQLHLTKPFDLRAVLSAVADDSSSSRSSHVGG